MDNNTDFVNVAIRIKPVSDYEQQSLSVISQKPFVLLLNDRSQTFSFDNIFNEEASQESIYNATAKPLVQHVKEGYNCTVFAYGQTGTGKTYTMGTNSNVSNKEDFGLIPRVLNHFFECTDGESSQTEISVSFIEIYNEKVFDLLQNRPLKVKGLKAMGCSIERVLNSTEAEHFLTIGNKNRHIGDTKQNLQSSRSHAIFTVYCSIKSKDVETNAKLNLVDLAGCESVKKTGSHGSTFQEAININRSLLTIGQVMTALSNNATYIPYRRSIITSLLQDSLNKQNFISLIACISPLINDTTETLQTLEFAQRVGKIKSTPQVNEVVSQYKKENPLLFQLKSNTPYKRPHTMQTPLIKKRHKPFQPILESNFSANSTDQSSSKKSFSTSVSSVSLDTIQHTLSPVIRKYINALEYSLMNKMELALKSSQKELFKESILKNRINEVSEIAHLSGNAIRATSSPIDHQLDNIRKCLSYDESDCNDTKNKENEFKIPSIPTLKESIKNSLVLSPIEKIVIRHMKPTRRSVRLSMKKKSLVILENKTTINVDQSLNELQDSKNCTTRNTSVWDRMLKEGKMNSPIGTGSGSLRNCLTGNTSTLNVSVNKENDFKIPVIPIKGSLNLSSKENVSVTPCRRSDRLSIKRRSKYSNTSVLKSMSAVESVFHISSELGKIVAQTKENSNEYFDNEPIILKHEVTIQRNIPNTLQNSDNNKTKNITVLNTPAGERTLRDRRRSSSIGPQLRNCLTCTDDSFSNAENKENGFKTPIIPPKKGSLKSSFVFSPIENIGKSKVKSNRRSVRLSVKRRSKCKNNNISIMKSPKENIVKSNINPCRRSVRLSMKRISKYNNNNISVIMSPAKYLPQTSTGFKNLAKNTKDKSTEYVECGKKQVVFSRNPANKRNSQSPGSCKTKNLTIFDTPTGKRLLREESKHSPYTAHTMNVLEIINNGNLRELEKLQTIGPKSAQQIALFREIFGKVNKLSDLGGIPGWNPKKFDKFVERNFLKKDLV